eukprot:14819755-Alexandrium_andersonii.AAC.1
MAGAASLGIMRDCSDGPLLQHRLRPMTSPSGPPGANSQGLRGLGIVDRRLTYNTKRTTAQRA